MVFEHSPSYERTSIRPLCTLMMLPGGASSSGCAKPRSSHVGGGSFPIASSSGIIETKVSKVAPNTGVHFDEGPRVGVTDYFRLPPTLTRQNAGAVCRQEINLVLRYRDSHLDEFPHGFRV